MIGCRRWRSPSRNACERPCAAGCREGRLCDRPRQSAWQGSCRRSRRLRGPCVLAVRLLDLFVLLAGPGSRMLSADTFSWTVSGRQEAASVLALVQTALVLAGYLAARWLLGRTPRQTALT